jgi:1-deoxy-D-xylulose-5-phosphate reductoisomerase
MKRIAVLGSTGSIGRAALEVIRHLGPPYRVWALSANSSWQLLAEQVREFRPERVVLGDERHAEAMRREMGRMGRAGSRPAPVLFVGRKALEDAAAAPEADVVLLAVVGAAGLPPAVAAVKAGKMLAIANKEPLVMAGDLIMRLARKTGARILPVDSEHSGVMQAMRSGARKEVRRIIITASGGPFYNLPAAKIRNATKAQALAHPTWKMGDKVTIDSATMMNKALEIIEAKWLFGLRPDQIEVVIHPQSVVHAVVEFCDGAMVAQVAAPDMKLPIQFALTHPERLDGVAGAINLAATSALTFIAPDAAKFPALKLGYQAAREGGTMGAVLSAANEVAVDAFLNDRLPFGGIVEAVGRVMASHRVKPRPTLVQVLEADRWARAEAERLIASAFAK